MLSIAAITVIAVVVLSWRAAWICDDALISFRYLRHLVEGEGLTFNSGERIEGFSNLLWILLLAPAKADPVTASIVLGILATATEVVIVVWFLDQKKAPLLVIAIVAGMLATDRITWVWATGGLETALHATLVTSVLALQLARPERIKTLAALHVLLVMSRPEGGVWFVVWLAHLAITRRWVDLRSALNIFVPAVAALLAARVLYYGAFVANPYRAKMGGVPTLEFGAMYTGAFLRRVGLWGVPALAIVPFLALAARARAADRAIVLALAFFVVHLVLVLAMGGDYMTDFRLLRPALGPLYLAIGLAAALCWSRWTAAALALVIAGHAYRQLEPVPIAGDAPPPADHQRILTIPRERPAQFADALFQFALAGDSVLADWGGYMSYGHDLRTIDATGLVSTNLDRDFYLRPERAETGARERLPGHARWPTIEMMQRERITFIFPKVNAKPPEQAEADGNVTNRTRDYPFLHVTVLLPSGQYLRFFTTLDAAQITERANRQRIRACYRPPRGELTCVDGTR